MSIPASTPHEEAKRARRESRDDDTRRIAAERLISSVSQTTGKQVSKIVVHFEDKTQITLRSETAEDRVTRRTRVRENIAAQKRRARKRREER